MVPCVLPNELACQHTPWRTHQHLQDCKLLGGEAQTALPATSLTCGRVEHHVTNLQNGRRGMIGTSHQRAQARHQLTQRVGFDEVVVGPQIETRNAIFHRIAGSRHEDARRRIPLPEGRAQQESVVIWQTDIEDHHVVRADGSEFTRHLPRSGGVHHKTGRSQECRCALPQRVVVFH